MKSATTRDTFITCKVLLDRLAGQCLDAERDLRRTLPEAEQPYRAGLELIADTQHSLASDIKKFADHGPASLLQTHLQYVPDHTLVSRRVDSVGAAIKHVERVNSEIDQALNDLKENAPQASVSDPVESLRRQLGPLKRKISLIRNSLRDA